MSDFNPEIIRQDFPIFQQKIYDKNLAFLDTAASAQKPNCVIDAYDYYYKNLHANINRGVYYLSAQATDVFERARVKIARYINADSHNCIFTRGTTEAINLVAHGIAENLNPDDEILITQMEHHANITPWQIICEKHQAKLKYINLNQDGSLNLDNLDNLINPNSKIKIISIVHVSNTLGTINPIKKIITLAKKYNIPVLIDGAQSIVHQKIDVQDLDCDFFVFSGHKLYGPTGVGVLYAKSQHLEKFSPYQTGGGMVKKVSLEKSEYLDFPTKFEAGTPAIAEVYALGKVIDYLNKNIDFKQYKIYEQELLKYTEDNLKKIPGLKIIGNAPEKSGIISFVLNKIHPHDIGTILDQHGVCVRVGHHCTMPIMDYYKIPATTRISFGIYTVKSEIDQLLNALNDIRKIFKL